MEVVWSKDHQQAFAWAPTTELRCAICQEAFQATHETMEGMNFVYDARDHAAPENGKYFYVHKSCAVYERAFDVFWGMYEMRTVLGLDPFFNRYYGDLTSHLKDTMPPGAYDALIEDWAPALGVKGGEHEAGQP